MQKGRIEEKERLKYEKVREQVQAALVPCPLFTIVLKEVVKVMNRWKRRENVRIRDTQRRKRQCERIRESSDVHRKRNEDTAQQNKIRRRPQERE